jgi:glycosidase
MGNRLVKIYEGLANDFAYAHPKDIMAFPDNHDMSRIFTQLKGDVEKTKMALAYLLTVAQNTTDILRHRNFNE